MGDYDPAAFEWPKPPHPPREWWEVEGAKYRMPDVNIRFAAAFHELGGLGSKKNTVAARLAGLPGGRTAAFRVANSASVRKLLAEANEIKTGRRAPLTEAEIDHEIAWCVRSKDPQTKAKGIELWNRRQAAASAVREPTCIEAVFGFLVSTIEPPLLGVVIAWALLDAGQRPRLYELEFGPHVLEAFPDIANVMGVRAVDGPVIPLDELLATVRVDVAEAQAKENAFHKQFGGDAREDELARLLKDEVCSLTQSGNGHARG